MSEAKNIYIAYEESYSGGDICAGQENDDWPSHEDTVVNLELLYASMTPPDDPHFDIEVIAPEANASKVYVTIVRYFDGDTFGRTCGLHRIEGVFLERKDAEQKRDAIKGAYFDPNQRNGRYDGNPWTGYFAGMESCEVEELEVR